jgi:hypothetical protein
MSSRLTRRRLSIGVVCLVTAGLAMFVAPAMQAGSTPAANGKVRVVLSGKSLGARGDSGRFTMSGALSDRGRFWQQAEVDFAGIRILYGAKGRIRIYVVTRQGPRASVAWRIIKGTKAYAGLRGRGTEREANVDPRRPGRFLSTMTGTVWRSKG